MIMILFCIRIQSESSLFEGPYDGGFGGRGGPMGGRGGPPPPRDDRFPPQRGYGGMRGGRDQGRHGENVYIFLCVKCCLFCFVFQEEMETGYVPTREY